MYASVCPSASVANGLFEITMRLWRLLAESGAGVASLALAVITRLRILHSLKEKVSRTANTALVSFCVTKSDAHSMLYLFIYLFIRSYLFLPTTEATISSIPQLITLKSFASRSNMYNNDVQHSHLFVVQLPARLCRFDRTTACAKQRQSSLMK